MIKNERGKPTRAINILTSNAVTLLFLLNFEVTTF
jgi:hypothetical protein